MTKQDLALANFAQKLSTGYLVLDIGTKLANGENVYELRQRLKQIKQLQKLFNTFYGINNVDTDLLQKTVFTINYLLNNYRLEGTFVVNETLFTSLEGNYLQLVVNDSSSSLVFSDGVNKTGNNVTADKAWFDERFIQASPLIPQFASIDVGGEVKTTYQFNAYGDAERFITIYASGISLGLKSSIDYHTEGHINYNAETFHSFNVGEEAYRMYEGFITRISDNKHVLFDGDLDGQYILASPLIPQLANIQIDQGPELYAQIGKFETKYDSNNGLWFGSRDINGNTGLIFFDPTMTSDTDPYWSNSGNYAGNRKFLLSGDVPVSPTGDFIYASPLTPQAASIFLNGNIGANGDLSITNQTSVLKHVLYVGNGDSIEDAFSIGSFDGDGNFSGFWRNFTTPITFYRDEITKAGLKYRDSDSYSNAEPLTLMPKEYIDNGFIQNLPILGSTIQNAQFRVDVGSLNQLMVGANFNEGGGAFHVRGVTYLDSSTSGGGVNFYGVATGDLGGINIGSAAEPVDPSSIHLPIIVDVNTGLLKRSNKLAVYEGDGSYIQASPISAQSASIDLDGSIFGNGQLIFGSATSGKINIATSNATLQHRNPDGVGGATVATYSDVDNGQVQIFAASTTGQKSLDLSTGDLTRGIVVAEQINGKGFEYDTDADWENLSPLGLPPKKYIDNGFIKASPISPQIADINLDGNIHTNLIRVASIEANPIVNPSIAIACAPGGQILFNMGNDGITFDTVNFGASGPTGTINTNFNNNSFKLLNTLPLDSSPTEIITRNSSTGELQYTGVSGIVGDYQLKSEKGAANGYASLGADGKVPNAQLNVNENTSSDTIVQRTSGGDINANNFLGNASSATSWNGTEIDNSVYGTVPLNVLGYDNTGGSTKVRAIQAPSLKSLLNLNDGSALNNVASSTTLWGGQPADFSSTIGTPFSFMGFNTGGTATQFSTSGAKSLLATSLQDVLSVNNNATTSPNFNNGISVGNGSKSISQYIGGDGSLRFYNNTVAQDQFVLGENGNVLIGSTINDGVNKLQVNGSAIVSGLTVKNAVLAAIDFVDGANAPQGATYNAYNHTFKVNGTTALTLDNLASNATFSGDITSKRILIPSFTKPASTSPSVTTAYTVNLNGQVGADNIATTGFALAGRGEDIRLRSGNGGASATSAGTKVGGDGGRIDLVAGDAGIAPSGTSGVPGDATLQGGAIPLGAGTPAREAGLVFLKGGTNQITSGYGGSIYLVPGYGSNNIGLGKNLIYDGNTFLGANVNGALRGAVIIGTNLTDGINDFQVTGNSIFNGKIAATTGQIATAPSAANDIVIKSYLDSQLSSIGTYADSTYAKKDSNLSLTANRTLVLGDWTSNHTLVLYVNATSGTVTITLPSASTMAGYTLEVIKTDSSANAVVVSGGVTNVNGATTYPVNTQYDTARVKSNGTQFYLIP